VLNQGGSALGLWAIDENVGVADSMRVAELAGCNQPELVDRIGCMETKPITEVIDGYMAYAVIFLRYSRIGTAIKWDIDFFPQKEQRKIGMLGTGGSMPVIQEAGKGYMEVITTRPFTTLNSGTYEARPMLTGTNKHEGIFALDCTNMKLKLNRFK